MHMDDLIKQNEIKTSLDEREKKNKNKKDFDEKTIHHSRFPESEFIFISYTYTEIHYHKKKSENFCI